MPYAHRYYYLGDVTLHAVQAGPASGPLAILLHGFPEHWYGWRKQIPALAQAGFHVCVPDQRGYNLSDKPRALRAYNLDRLAEDVLGLIEATGHEHAVLVGHDWGAAVAWWTAIKFPRSVSNLIVLNVPHPIVARRFARRSLEQILRSWYIGFFQVPWLPEFLLRLNGWQVARAMMLASARSDTFSESDLARYVTAWSQPGAMRSMINWYRAAARTRTARLSDLRVHVPTRIIWGVGDVALSRRLAPLSLEMCDDGDLFFIERATHWVQHDESERVNELILQFIQPS